MGSGLFLAKLDTGLTGYLATSILDRLAVNLLTLTGIYSWKLCTELNILYIGILIGSLENLRLVSCKTCRYRGS